MNRDIAGSTRPSDMVHSIALEVSQRARGGERDEDIVLTLDEMPISNFKDHKLSQIHNTFKDRKPI